MMFESDYRAITATTRERWSFTSTARLTARLTGRKINSDDECKHGRYLLLKHVSGINFIFPLYYKICILKAINYKKKKVERKRSIKKKV